MPQKSKTVPLAKWLTSRDPALRARAETTLYNLGPNAGDALFRAAEYTASSRENIKIVVTGLSRLIVEAVIFGIIAACDSKFTLIWCAISAGTLLRIASRLAQTRLLRGSQLRAIGLALSKRDDLRAIGPLLDGWSPLSAFALPRNDDLVEKELTRLLPRFLTQTTMDLRSYRRRVLRRKGALLLTRRVRGSRLVPRQAFSDTRTDLLVMLAQLLVRSGASADRALVEQMSRLTEGTPNSDFVRDAARSCLQHPMPTEPVLVRVAPERANRNTRPEIAG